MAGFQRIEDDEELLIIQRGVTFSCILGERRSTMKNEKKCPSLVSILMPVCEDYLWRAGV